MLETILSGSNKRISNSGPGPQELLFGDSELGYYGRVTATECGLNYTAVNNLPGTLLNRAPMLLKFAVKGEVLFIPTAAYRFQLQWFDVYRAGAAYGSDNVGWNYNTTAVMQNFKVGVNDATGKRNIFRVRLPYAIDTLNPNNQPEKTRFNEIPELFGRVTDGRWDNLTLRDVHMSSEFDTLGGWSMTTGSIARSNGHWWYIGLGGQNSVNSLSNAAKDFTYTQLGLRPVFVYMP